MKSIITAKEVVFASDASRDFSVSLIDKRIEVLERTVFRDQSIGYGNLDFHAKLLENVSAAPVSATEYNPSQTYSLNDIVWQNGQYFKSVANSNNDDPVSLTNWILVPKFDQQELEDLWINYIRPWLANAILSRVLSSASYQIGQKGVTEWADERTGQRSAGVNSMRYIKQELKMTITDCYREMMEEIWRMHEAKEFDFTDWRVPGLLHQIEDRARRSRVSFRY